MTDIPLLRQPFWFLRHGESQANLDDLVAGSTDTPLTDKGRAQAEAAAEKLKDIRLASIWHSPLIRARQTAEAVTRLNPVPMFPLPGLAERNWGGWEGQPNSILVREATPPGGGDSPAVFRARIRAALAAISGPFPVLIVAHSGTAREISGLLLPDAPFVRLDNAVPVLWQQEGADRHWTCTPLS